MKTLCEGCHTFYDLPKGQEGRIGCPYCEHINRAFTPKMEQSVPSSVPQIKSDHNSTMIGYLDGSLQDEITEVKRFIQNNQAGLPKEEKLVLVLEAESQPKEEFQIIKEKLTIGRKGCDILLDDPEVSRAHCAIECYNGTAILKDLGSSNGTMLNQKIIKENFLKDLDEIQAGNTIFRFYRKPGK